MSAQVDFRELEKERTFGQGQDLRAGLKAMLGEDGYARFLQHYGTSKATLRGPCASGCACKERSQDNEYFC